MYMKTIEELMEYIGQRYVFNADHYPALQHDTIDPKLFGISHSVLHMNKSLGKIAAEAEYADHGGTLSQDELEKATTKMLINVLKLAETIGMTPDQLASKIPEVMKSK
jgi:hypothetical protein